MERKLIISNLVQILRMMTNKYAFIVFTLFFINQIGNKEEEKQLLLIIENLFNELWLKD